MTNALIQAVTDELLAHGEFSSAGNNRPNAEVAAKAVIDIVLAAPQALAATPAADDERVLAGEITRLRKENSELASRLIAATPAVGGEVTWKTVVKAICCPHGCVREDDCLAGERREQREQATAVVTALAQPASPLQGVDVVARCMEILEDVPGEHLIDRVHRIVDWHQQLSERYHDQPASPLRGSADQIWNALKDQCAATKDKSEVKTLVTVRHSDVVAAIAALSTSPPEQPAAALTETERFTGNFGKTGA